MSSKHIGSMSGRSLTSQSMTYFEHKY